jgi:hypothetical protein
MNRHPPELRHQAVSLVEGGTPNVEVARRLGVPSGTVGYWVHLDRAQRGACPGRERPCHRCDGAPLDRAAYSYLLGLYLGDGHVSLYSAHRAPSLVITCGDDWPGLMDAAEAAMRAVFPHNQVCRLRRTGCHNVKLYSQHAWCMFPQHGPGKKHERTIALEGWQQEIVDAFPWEFIRGLIHSDGCRVTNWTVRTVGGERKRYEYPRYLFTNVSDDIRRLYCDALDKVGVTWRVTRRGDRPYNISVARRACVALMDLRVGAKY